MFSTFKVTYVHACGDTRTFVTLASSKKQARKLCLENAYGAYKIVSVEKKPVGMV